MNDYNLIQDKWYNKALKKLRIKKSMSPAEFARKYKDKLNLHVAKVEKKYLEQGIPVRMYEDSEGYFYLSFDLTKMQPNTKFSRMILSYQKMYPELDLSEKLIYRPKELVEASSLGQFNILTGEINIGVTQATKLDDDIVDMTLKHELRHAAFFMRRQRGINGPFDFHFEHLFGRKMKGLGSYKNALSAEELYTFSKMTRESRLLINKYLAEGKTLEASKLLSKEASEVLDNLSNISKGLIDLSQRTSIQLEKTIKAGKSNTAKIQIHGNNLHIVLRSKKDKKGNQSEPDKKRDTREKELNSYITSYPIHNPRLLERLKIYKVLSNEERDKLDLEVAHFVLEQSKALEEKAKIQLALSEKVQEKLNTLMKKHDEMEKDQKNNNQNKAETGTSSETQSMDFKLNEEISNLMNEISHITQ